MRSVVAVVVVASALALAFVELRPETQAPQPTTQAQADVVATPVANIAPCEWQGIAADCGTLDVPENHAQPDGRDDGRAISLFFVIVRATEAATDEPVFYFSGGPGTPASRSARGLAEEHALLRRTRDFVFIDQRGTGQSAPLRCDVPQDPARMLQPMFNREEAAACRAALEPHADFRRYTTTDAARDIDLVRRALGYERINLIGTSYGTRMAWTYAAMFPAHARTLLLVGPVPPGFSVPLPFSKGLDVALDGLLDACEADDECGAAYPSLRDDTRRAFERLRSGDQERERATGDQAISYGEFAEAVRYALYTPATASTLPRTLTRAAAGDYASLIETATEHRRNLERAVFKGMYLSVTCAEDIPFISEEDAQAATEGTRLGDYRLQQQREACAEWPQGEPLHASTSAPIDTPALVEAGVYDPATPLVQAREAMSRLPNGTLVEVPHGGHGFAGLSIDACLVDIERQFIERGHARDLDTSCVKTARRPSFQVVPGRP